MICIFLWSTRFFIWSSLVVNSFVLGQRIMGIGRFTREKFDFSGNVKRGSGSFLFIFKTHSETSPIERRSMNLT